MSKVLGSIQGSEEVSAAVTSHMLIENVTVESNNGYQFIKGYSEKTGAPLSVFLEFETSLLSAERAILINPEKGEKGWKCAMIEEVASDFKV